MAFYTATRGERPARALIWMAYAVGGAVTFTALMPTLWMALLTLVVVGATTTAFLTLGNAVMQLHSVPEMRGRVMALRAAAVLGSRPLGAPIVGWIGERFGPRYGLALGAVAALAVAAWAHRWVATYARSRT